MHTIESLLKQGVRQLRASGTDTPVLDAEVLLVDVLNKYGYEATRVTLVLRSFDMVSPEVEAEFLRRVGERSTGKPVQYLTGRQEFMGLDFCVAEGVLIPRPDTEIIVEKLIDMYKHKGSVSILDMCTGTGAIAISLAWYLPQACVYAADLSPIAMACCKDNVKRMKLEERVTVVGSDLFSGLRGLGLEGTFDVVVSNPPYIRKTDLCNLPASVRCYEPEMALDGGVDGLEFYRRITLEAAVFLKKDAVLAYEIGYDQSRDVAEIIKLCGFYSETFIEKDLAGLDRCVWTRRNGVC